MIEKIIYSLLSNSTAVTALVNTRIYPLIRDQADGLPAITYQTISGIRDYDLGGPNGLVDARVQINCFAATQLGAAELSAVVRNLLNGFKGGAAGYTVDCMLLDDESDLPVFDMENEAMNVYAKTMDFFVQYKE